MAHARDCMTARVFFERLKDLWTVDHVVERLLACSKRSSGSKDEESHWLELKATLCPPKVARERYHENWRKDRFKSTSDDYVLHVIKAICAMMNNVDGGIVAIGVANDGTPAEFANLCDDPTYLPVPSNEGGWETDDWANWTLLKLRQDVWTDRYGCEWTCSVPLKDTALLSMTPASFRGAPVLVLALDPSPRPVQLFQRCCPCGHDFESERNAVQWADRELRKLTELPDSAAGPAKSANAKRLSWCGFPHSPPESKDQRPVSHVFKRINGGVAADNLWTLDELLDFWNGERTSFSAQFENLLAEETRIRRGFSIQTGISEFSSIDAIREIHGWTFQSCARNEPVKLTVSSAAGNPGKFAEIVFVREDGILSAGQSGASCCVAYSAACGVDSPCSVHLDLDRLYENDWEKLVVSTESFISNAISDAYGGGGVFSAKLWSTLFSSRGVCLFVSGWASVSRDARRISLFFQAVRSFLERSATANRTCRLFLFGFPRHSVSGGWPALEADRTVLFPPLKAQQPEN